MASGRWSYGNGTFVDAPTFHPAGGGVLDVAEVRDVQSGDPALRGYTYETELGDIALGTVTGYAQSSTAAMAEGQSHNFELSFDPFTIYAAAGVDAGAGDTEASVAEKAQRRFELAEGLTVERAMWETGGILPAQASLLRSGNPIRTKLAIGILAEWYAQNTNGTPYFWGGRRIANEIAANQLVDFDVADAEVKGGGALINGAGFFAKTTIAGVTPSADQVWLYATGTPLLYRGTVGTTSGGFNQPTASANNRLVAFASRTYVPSIDGPVAAVLVDLTL